MVLVEQGDMIRRTITDAGFSGKQVRLAAEHFEGTALGEWERVANMSSTTAYGSV